MLKPSCVGFLLVLLQTNADAARYRLRWVLVHNHTDAIERSVLDFASRVKARTHGDVAVEILTPAQYGAKYGGGESPPQQKLMNDVASGKIEMYQAYTKTFSRYLPRLTALGIPFIFRDYDHAEAVMEGPIGRRLLDDLRSVSPVRALAFTYSGGFVVMATTNRIVDTPERLRGLRMLMMPGNVSALTATRLGFQRVPGPPERFVPLFQAGRVDSVETTYSCFAGYGDDAYAKTITDTEHFLLTTLIVINDRFFQSLPEPYQNVITRTAEETARQERRESIELLAKRRRELERRGVRIVELSPEQKAAYRKALAPVGDQLAKELGADFIEQIRSAGRTAPALRD